MLPLHGIGVLVTRPRQQAAALCRLLEAQGASVERFAAIEIEPIDERREWAARFGELQQFGLIIFTSANAVILLVLSLAIVGIAEIISRRAAKEQSS